MSLHRDLSMAANFFFYLISCKLFFFWHSLLHCFMFEKSDLIFDKINFELQNYWVFCKSLIEVVRYFVMFAKCFFNLLENQNLFFRVNLKNFISYRITYVFLLFYFSIFDINDKVQFLIIFQNAWAKSEKNQNFIYFWMLNYFKIFFYFSKVYFYEFWDEGHITIL